MRKVLTLLGALSLAVLSCTANAAQNPTASCTSTNFGEHQLVFDNTSVHMHGDIYTLRTTNKLPNGSNLYIFFAPVKGGLLLGMNPQADGSTAYMISDMKRNTIDTGICK